MRNSEFIRRLKSFFLFFIPQSAFRIPHFSTGQQKVLFLLALLILALIYSKFYYRPASPPEETYPEVVVEILGKVQKPGVYVFKNPPTLREVIEKGGGLKGNIPVERGVSSEIMETGTLINVVREESVIPPYPPLAKGGEEEILAKGGEEEILAKGDEGGIFEKRGSGEIVQNVIKIRLGRMEPRKLLAFSIPMDLNRVSVEDLCLIPGIGESLARQIITYRERRRGFRSVEELMDVKGIEEKKYRSLKPFFTVRP